MRCFPFLKTSSFLNGGFLTLRTQSSYFLTDVLILLLRLEQELHGRRSVLATVPRISAEALRIHVEPCGINSYFPRFGHISEILSFFYAFLDDCRCIICPTTIKLHQAPYFYTLFTVTMSICATLLLYILP